MAQTYDITGYDVGRQDTIVAKAEVTFGTGATKDTAATGTLKLIAIPAGAIVTGGFVAVTDATTANVDIHIGDGADNDRYAADVDGAALGGTALVGTGYEYTADDTIDMYIDTAAPAADGAATVVVEYIIDGRAAFVQK